MTKKEIATYYKQLSNGEKGRFTAFLSLELGSSPHTWQQKLLRWSNDNIQTRAISPIIESALTSIIEGGTWK